MTNPPRRGQSSTPDNPCNSPVMKWIAAHLSYDGEGCLTWPFGCDGRGYGLLLRRGRSLKAHRYICEWVKGPPPSPKHHAAHSCGRGDQACVDQRHLDWKTPAANYKESAPHPKYKLTLAQVLEIRPLKGVEKPNVTAARYGVTERTIRKIHNGDTWKTDACPRPFTAEEIAAIRAMQGLKSPQAIGAIYGVNRAVIWRIQKGTYNPRRAA